MESAAVQKVRNQAMELAKFVTSCFVVFMHIPFPGRFGELIAYIGQFAVPLFFMLSGYFNYRASCDRILERAKRIFRLYLIGGGARILWLALRTAMTGGTLTELIYLILPDQEGLTGWIITQKPLLSGHLWYLHAMVLVYLLYWAYVRFCGEDRADDTPLYFAGFTLFAIYFTIAVLYSPEGEELIYVYRNAYIMGLPFFIAGIFFREYGERILRCFGLTNRKLGAAVCIGVLLTVQQWIRCAVGMPLGMLLAVMALLLLTAEAPVLSCRGFGAWLCTRCGGWSVWIYLFHVIVSEAYDQLLGGGELAEALGGGEEWLRPIAVLALSWAAAVVCSWVQRRAKNRTDSADALLQRKN